MGKVQGKKDEYGMRVMKAMLKSAICWVLSEESQWRVWGLIDKETPILKDKKAPVFR